MTGENGGAAFVVIYLLCVFFIGLPLLYNELALGRASGKNPIDAFKATGDKWGFWITGLLCTMTCFFVLSYYGVIAGWTIGYTYSSIVGKDMVFAEFAANPSIVIPLFAVFIFLTIFIVQAGVEKGIEKWSKILMPVLFVIIGVVVIRSVTLEGASEGLKYYLSPDFSKIKGSTFITALGQAFFSMSVGWGLMITYGSYMPKGTNLIVSGFWVAIADTAVAIMAGLMIFPAVFALGFDPSSGPALTFITLPAVFEQMPLGGIFGALFFLLLTIAAVTSSISMLEVPVSYFVDKGKSRKTAAWIVGIAAFIVGLPSAASQGGVEWLSSIHFLGEDMSFLDHMDKYFGTMAVILVSLLLSVYTGWFWKTSNAVKELADGYPGFTKPIIGNISQATVWAFIIRIVCPLLIGFMLYKGVAE